MQKVVLRETEGEDCSVNFRCYRDTIYELVNKLRKARYKTKSTHV